MFKFEFKIIFHSLDTESSVKPKFCWVRQIFVISFSIGKPRLLEYLGNTSTGIALAVATPVPGTRVPNITGPVPSLNAPIPPLYPSPTT